MQDATDQPSYTNGELNRPNSEQNSVE
jgi:hypothetical protein